MTIQISLMWIRCIICSLYYNLYKYFKIGPEVESGTTDDAPLTLSTFEQQLKLIFNCDAYTFFFFLMPFKRFK